LTGGVLATAVAAAVHELTDAWTIALPVGMVTALAFGILIPPAATALERGTGSKQAGQSVGVTARFDQVPESGNTSEATYRHERNPRFPLQGHHQKRTGEHA
jgi:hypothetical protein